MTHAKLTLSCVPAATPLVAAHTHDCGHCKFLGQLELPGCVPQDIYVCPKSDHVPHDELIVRYGPQGDYRSLPASVADGVQGSTLWTLASIAYSGYAAGRYGPA